MDESLYCVKMRASRNGVHVSGAERIVPSDAVPTVTAQLAARALGHSKGVPDFINVKIERPGEIVRLKALPVATHVTRTPTEGRALAAELLRGMIREISGKDVDLLSYIGPVIGSHSGPGTMALFFLGTER